MSVISNASFDPTKVVYKNVDIPNLPGKICFELRNVFTPEECQALIQWSEKTGYSDAKINIGDKAYVRKDVRNSLRCMIDDFDVSRFIFERVRPYLPEKQAKNWCLTSVNERLRFLKYNVGNMFAPHYDGVYEREDGSEISYLTIQLYLNEDFEGGTTRMYSDKRMNSYCDVVPKIGKVVIFEHHILHEGTRVSNGTKYTIRSDIMYRYRSY